MRKMLLCLVVSCGVLAEVTPSWTNYYRAFPDGTGYPSGAAIDSGGNVIVGGFPTIKYSPHGGQQWVVQDAAGDGDILVDPSDNVFVVGFGPGSFDLDSVLSKYSSWGAQVWTTFVDAGNTASDLPLASVLDSHGDMIIVQQID